MSILTSPIDYNSLEKDLQDALEADKLYQLQNDAKIRAVEQRVPTYEHFRQMVNGAHLQPLQNADMKIKIEVPWNSIVHTNNSADDLKEFKHASGEHADGMLDKPILNVIPKSCKDFAETWMKITDIEQKFTYLWRVRDLLQNKIFSMEIPPFIFGELIKVCFQNISTISDVQSVIDILIILSECNRFNLTVSFMANSEKIICSELFQQLYSKSILQNESFTDIIRSLSAKYQVTRL